MLDDEDIERYAGIDSNTGIPGQFTPVYLDQFGGWYYVNRIKNYKSGYMTKTELIKL